MGGIYRCDAVQQDVIATGQGFGAKCAVFVVNETGITTKAAFLDKIAAVMAFPDYFGRNWDALNDCLTDPPAAPASGTILILENCDEFARHEPDEWHTAVAVFASAAETRKRMSTPLYVLISHGCPPVASARPLPCEGFPQETVQLHVEMFTMRSEPND
ncbi:MAG: barstar family protein [Thermomicrobiales bacterium]